MNPAPRDESLETQYASACTTLAAAVLYAKGGTRWDWCTGPGVAKLSSACRPFLDLHSRVAPPSALASFPLMLHTLLVFARSHDADPYTLRSADSEAVATNDGALRVGLEALCALSETVPPADDLVGYRSQFRDFSRLLTLEKTVDKICRRLGEEMGRSYPRVSMLLGCVIDFQRLLNAEVVPFWLIDFCGFPDHLVRLTHVCRRFGVLEDKRLWRELRVRAVECLEGAHIAQDDGYECGLLAASLHYRSFHELEVSLPLLDRDSAFSEEWDNDTRRTEVTEADFERGSPPMPLSVWRPFDRPPHYMDGRDLLTTRIVVEFAHMSGFLAAHHPEVYRGYQRHLIEARNDDRYPFRPVNVYGPYSDAEDWNFADYYREDNPFHFPDEEDWDERVFVGRVIAVDERRRNGAGAADAPMPTRGDPSLFDQP